MKIFREERRPRGPNAPPPVDRIPAYQWTLEDGKGNQYDRKDIVLCLNGIRTNAEWIDDLKALSKEFAGDVIVDNPSCDTMYIPNLMFRFGLRKRRYQIKQSLRHSISMYRMHRISLICHSMGTDNIARILDEYDKSLGVEFKFENIIFIGSICSSRYVSVIRKYCNRFVNIRGTKDRWSIAASVLNPWHYDPSGCFGFSDNYRIESYITDDDHFSCTDSHSINMILMGIILGFDGAVELKERKSLSTPFSFNISRYIKNLFLPFLAIILITIFLYLVGLVNLWALILLALPLFIADLASLIYLFRTV